MWGLMPEGRWDTEEEEGEGGRRKVAARGECGERATEGADEAEDPAGAPQGGSTRVTASKEMGPEVMDWWQLEEEGAAFRRGTTMRTRRRSSGPTMEGAGGEDGGGGPLEHGECTAEGADEAEDAAMQRLD